jgi:L-ascorbate metabolism protein UlaG (beta-lactamase superfamily)
MTLEVEFVGHSALVLELDGVRLLTDPAIRGRIGPLRRTVAEPSSATLSGIDAVLISHLHWDHLDVPSLQRLGASVPLLVPTGAGAWLGGLGFGKVREVAVGQPFHLGGLEITATRAHHSGFRPPTGPTAEAVGFVVRGSRSVYFAGDTDIFPEMAGMEGTIDLALLPVWGWGPLLGRGRHMDPLRAATSLRHIRPSAAVPIHWGTYWPHALGLVYPQRLVEPPAAFVEYAAELAPDVRTLPTPVGDRVDLPRW